MSGGASARAGTALPAWGCASPGSPVALTVPEATRAQVWLVYFDADEATLASLEESLTLAECDRARRGAPTVHRRRVLLRAALRQVLGRRLGMPVREVPLQATPAGRPHLPGTTGLDLSCSAGDRIGLVAVAEGHRVGVDMEPVAPWSPDVLAEGWLCPAEAAALVGLPMTDRALAVTRSWTQKEAVLKGLGTGLSGGPAGVRTTVGQTTGRIDGWDVRDIPVPAGSVATVATRFWPDADPW